MEPGEDTREYLPEVAVPQVDFSGQEDRQGHPPS